MSEVGQGCCKTEYLIIDITIHQVRFVPQPDLARIPHFNKDYKQALINKIRVGYTLSAYVQGIWYNPSYKLHCRAPRKAHNLLCPGYIVLNILHIDLAGTSYNLFGFGDQCVSRPTIYILDLASISFCAVHSRIPDSINCIKSKV